VARVPAARSPRISGPPRPPRRGRNTINRSDTYGSPPYVCRYPRPRPEGNTSNPGEKPHRRSPLPAQTGRIEIIPAIRVPRFESGNPMARVLAGSESGNAVLPWSDGHLILFRPESFPAIRVREPPKNSCGFRRRGRSSKILYGGRYPTPSAPNCRPHFPTALAAARRGPPFGCRASGALTHTIPPPSISSTCAPWFHSRSRRVGTVESEAHTSIR